MAFVRNTITITGESGEEVCQTTRDKIAFLRQSGFTVPSIQAHGVFSFQGKVPLTFDEDDPQDVMLPVGRKLMRIGEDGGLPCVPTADTVVVIEALAEGEAVSDQEVADLDNLLDILDEKGRKLDPEIKAAEEAAKAEAVAARKAEREAKAKQAKSKAA